MGDRDTRGEGLAHIGIKWSEVKGGGLLSIPPRFGLGKWREGHLRLNGPG